MFHRVDFTFCLFLQNKQKWYHIKQCLLAFYSYQSQQILVWPQKKAHACKSGGVSVLPAVAEGCSCGGLRWVEVQLFLLCPEIWNAPCTLWGRAGDPSSETVSLFIHTLPPVCLKVMQYPVSSAPYLYRFPNTSPASIFLLLGRLHKCCSSMHLIFFHCCMSLTLNLRCHNTCLFFLILHQYSMYPLQI